MDRQDSFIIFRETRNNIDAFHQVSNVYSINYGDFYIAHKSYNGRRDTKCYIVRYLIKVEEL